MVEMSKSNLKIKKILIANRGEIVKRVALSAKQLGIQTLGVFIESEKISGALPFHCRFCDFSHQLEGETLQETYLNIKQIIQVAKENQCDAVHPGYGFLSENSSFAKELEKNNIIFIGPNVESIDLMGSKKTSKDYVEKLGLPTIPGYQGDDQTFERFQTEAERIGYPVLLKASAGGGGKGMRMVADPKDLQDGFDAAKREGLNSFGDDTLLIEKYLEDPRHIEFQVLSDSHGNHIHLYERECSIQRRHQKIVEEAPSPTLLPELREKMGDASVKLTSGLNYLGAGTIEYMVDKYHNFYFLEMNTRLQVEHPITEETTGVDLVKQQILIAAGEELALKQEDIQPRQHSVELRLYAEDPDNNFLPDTGKVHKIELPNYPGFRWDGGIESGSLITVNFDPMCGKMVFTGQDRQSAIALAIQVLEEMVFDGPKTNREYLLRILKHKAFLKAEISTHFIPNHAKELESKDPTQQEMAASLAALNLIFKGSSASTDGANETADRSVWGNLGGFRNV